MTLPLGKPPDPRTPFDKGPQWHDWFYKLWDYTKTNAVGPGTAVNEGSGVPILDTGASSPGNLVFRTLTGSDGVGVTNAGTTVNINGTSLSSSISSLSTSTSTGLSTVTSSVVSLSTSTSTGLSTHTSQITSLSTGLSTTNSNVTSLSTSTSTGLSTVTSSVTSLSTSTSTGLSTHTSQITSLSTQVNNTTGTGAYVLANTPTLITPVIGAATGTSLTLTGALSAFVIRSSTSSNSVASGTPVTVFTIPGGIDATYLVSCNIGVTNDITNYSAFAIIMADGTTARISLSNNGALQTITLSGLNIQSTQNSGATHTINATITRIA